MVRFGLAVSLFVAVSAAIGFEEASKQQGGTIVPGAYIFEFEDDHDSTAFYAKAATENCETRRRFDYKLFKGASVQFSDVQSADERAMRMASLPAVKRMWPVQLYKIPDPIVEWVGSPEVDFVTMRKRDTNGSSSDTFSPHAMTQVDKLQAEGITGKGIKVAIVDTGIDYNHPALGGCFGSNCLVSFGTDLVGDAYTGFNVPRPDSDPMDCQGHGTHVAGTIAAQKTAFGFNGAAPGVTLGAYRVFGCSGEAANDVLIAAFNQAFEDGADIITSSIGSPCGWSEEPWAVTVSRIVEQGVPCTLAAGNSGESGLFYASTAAQGKGVTAIASFDNSKSIALLTVSRYTVDGSYDQEFGYTPGLPSAWDGVKLHIWAPSFDTQATDMGCEDFSANTTDLSQHIVLMRRGSCAFTQKAQNAVKAGAKYVLIYNNAEGTGGIDASSVTGLEAIGMVTAEQGEEWVGQLKAGSEVILSVENATSGGLRLLQLNNNATGGAVSVFTSWGPTWEMDVKPQFGAPGGSILSTYPVSKGSYAVLSGTSMACPLAAAIVALIAEVRGTLDPELIENLMSASSNPQLFSTGAAFSGFLAPVPQQGGGLVQAYDAAYATTLLYPSSLSFNDTDNFVETRNFTLKNTWNEEITYEISHVPAGTMYTIVERTIYPKDFPNEAVTDSASIRFSEDKVTLSPGDQVAIEVLPTPPEGLNGTRLPIWSGYVAINGSDGSSYSIPYQGLTGSLHSSQVLGARDTWISSSDNGLLFPVAPNKTFTLPPPGTIDAKDVLGNATTRVLPTLVWFLALGSAKLTADIVPVGSSSNSTKSIGQPDTFPLLWNPRGRNKLPWTGELNNGEYAPPGMYKVLYRALRIFGDESNEEDWDMSESPIFGIQYDEK